jgi:hypothetical protein
LTGQRFHARGALPYDDSRHRERPGVVDSERQMQFVLVVIAWFLLLVIAWPLAIALVVLLPLLWLLSIPFRIIAVLLAAVLAFIKALLFLPARLLGHRG